MTNYKTREDFEAWAMANHPELMMQFAHNRPSPSYFNHLLTWTAATQQSAARIASLEAENDAIAELNHAQWLALENVRHLAARNRKEEWAQHLLRFVEQAGTNKAQIMRKQVDATALEAEVLALRKDATPIPAHELVTMYDERPTSDLEMIEFAREVERRHGIGVRPQHITNGSPCWCNPDVAYTDPETGASVIVHRRPQ